MTRPHVITWIASSLAAIAVHSVAVLAFAALLGERLPPPRNELRLDQTNIFATRPLGETAAAPLDATASDAGETVQAAGNDEVVEERTDVAAVEETSVQAPSAALTEAESSISESQAPIASQASNGGAVISERTEAAAIGETRVQASSASVATAGSPLSETTGPSLSESPAPNQFVTSESTSSPAASAASAGVIVPEASPDVVPSSNPTDVAVNASGSAVATPVAQQSANDAVGVSESPSLQPRSESGEAAVTPSSSGSSEAGMAGTGTVVAETRETTAPAATPAVEAAPVTETAEAVTATESSAPVLGETQVAIVLPRPQTPLKPVEPPPAPSRDVLSAVRGFGSAPCFLAVPEQAVDGEWRLRTYAAGQETLADFESHLREAVGEVPNRQSALQQAQCAAADFASGLLQGAPSPLAFSLGERRLVDGGRLRGTVTALNRKWAYLLLVDDDGMISDVSRFAAVDGGDLTFDIPVHIKGDGRSRTQLLLAVASDKPITLLDLKEPKPLAEVLPFVRGQIKASKAEVDIAVQDFSVQ